MNTYIRLEGYPHYYFRVLKEGESMDWRERYILHERHISDVMNNISEHNTPSGLQFLNLCYSVGPIDYEAVASKYHATVLIRPNGTWMTLNEDHVILDTVEAINFPEPKKDNNEEI